MRERWTGVAVMVARRVFMIPKYNNMKVYDEEPRGENDSAVVVFKRSWDWGRGKGAGGRGQGTKWVGGQ